MSGGGEKILHFSIGPVQGFIADARRLRDFWAGSFLLSWLAGQAMKAVVENGGTIVFPKVDGDELFEAINNPADATAYIGSLPNRFKAKVPDGFDPQECVKAVEGAWKRLADKIWNEFVGPVVDMGYGNDTRDIWDRQVNNFWEITWVMGDDPSDKNNARWLDQRKNWRTHWQEDEESDLCTLMGHYQELSGYTRIHDRDAQAAFWKALTEQEYLHPHTQGKRSLRELNLRPDERLCAIALIKRVFPLIAKDVLGWWPGGDKLSTINWPSTSYIAAVPWLKTVEKSISGDARNSYPALADKLGLRSYKGETETRLFGLPQRDFFNLDGHLLHEDGVAAWCKENISDEGKRKRAREALQQKLKALRDASGGRPTEFYAILKMDGDRIGEKLGNPGTAGLVKEGLATFTAKVKTYFDPAKGNPANGVLVYAGGDDVLAFLPVNSAIDAAYKLRALYDASFKAAYEELLARHDAAFDEGKAIDLASFTMSAAIVFTHFKNPLRHALEKAEHYLDDVAKDKNGRDSLAIAVMKPGGIAFDWVSCWQDGNGSEPGRVMMEVAKKAIGGEDATYSTGFLYNVRERYKPIFASDDDEHGGAAEHFSDMIERVLVAEYKKQPRKGSTPYEKAKAAITPLLTIGRPLRRDADGTIDPVKHYDFNAALIARFIAVEGFCHKPRKKEKQEEAA